MTRHDSYREGAWAIWPKDQAASESADYLCWDTPEECVAAHDPRLWDFPRLRLVRLHRVSIEDVLHEAGNYSWLSTEVVAAMAKLGVALTERWVAAETREIEPTAKVKRFVRLPKTVYSDMPGSAHHAMPGLYEAYVNMHGAVSVRDSHGDLLGVKPGEFEWCDEPIEPAAKVEAPATLEQALTTIEATSENWDDAQTAAWFLVKNLAKMRAEMDADPLLSRLLAAWSKISNMGRKCLVDDAIERKHWNPRKEGA